MALNSWRKLHNPKVIKLVALVGIIAMQNWSAFDHWSKFDNLWFNVECISSIISLCVEYHSFFLRWVIWNVGNGGKLQRSLLFTCFWITIQWWSNTSLISFWIFVVSAGASKVIGDSIANLFHCTKWRTVNKQKMNYDNKNRPFLSLFGARKMPRI